MKTVIKAMIVLGVISLSLGSVIGCKKKTEEALLDEIEKRESPKQKEVVLQIGKSIRYWKYSMVSPEEIKKETEISLIFEHAFISKTVPWDPFLQRELAGKKYLIVYAHVENMGPREGTPSCIKVEVKAANGFIYSAKDYPVLFGRIGRPVTALSRLETGTTIEDWQPLRGSSGLFSNLKQGEKAWWAFFGEMPEDAIPVELFGELGEYYYTEAKFRLRLPKNLTDSGKVEESKEPGGPTGIESIPESEMTWVLCTNTSCGASYEMSLREFSKQLESKAQGRMPMNGTPMLTCQKCGKESIVKAIKCEKCGNVFREYSVPADFADRCPKCKYSKVEATRKARLGVTAPSQ